MIAFGGLGENWFQITPLRTDWKKGRSGRSQPPRPTDEPAERNAKSERQFLPTGRDKTRRQIHFLNTSAHATPLRPPLRRERRIQPVDTFGIYGVDLALAQNDP